MSKIIIIGSGLAGVAAAKILIKKGIKPIIIDYGLDLEESKKKLKTKISNMSMSDWKLNDLNDLTNNNTLNKRFPRKFYMGSDYFYMKNNEFVNFDFINKKNMVYPPASSLAIGGLSNGWASAVMPISLMDKEHFPYDIKDLSKYYIEALKDIKYSSATNNDESLFENIKEPDTGVRFSNDIKHIFEKLKKTAENKKDLYFNSSNLLTNFEKITGCKNCGQCVSGCFYDHIYKAKKDLENLIEKNKIEYKKNLFVESYSENKNKITILTTDKNYKKLTFNCDKLIIAAGALNSTIIFAKSNNLQNYKFNLLSKNGFVSPIFTTSLKSDEWPNRHTLPLMNFVKFDKHGSTFFSQISKANELVIKKFYGKQLSHSILSKFIASYFLFAHCNLSSSDSDYYEISINKKDKTEIRIEKKENLIQKIKLNVKVNHYKKFLKESGLFLLDFIKIKTESQHNGCSLPMKKKITNPNEIDLNGNSQYSKNIFYVDSSTFPFLPSTPIGLPIMAHSMRIVDKINFN